MPRYDHECIVCGLIQEVVCGPDDSPACACGSPTHRIWIKSAPVHGDDIPGGQWFENGFKTPRKFYSHSEHRAALAAEGLQITAKNAGDHDKICRRWDAPDAVTLSNAAILLTRGSQAVREKNDRWSQATMPITVTDLTTGVKARDLE